MNALEIKKNYSLPESFNKEINILFTLRDLITTYIIFFLSFYILTNSNNNFLLFFSVFFLGVSFNWMNVQTHEACHYLLIKNKKLNDLFSNFFYGILSLRTVNHYRLSHLAHHLRLRDNENDPDFHLYNTKLSVGIFKDLLLLTFFNYLVNNKKKQKINLKFTLFAELMIIILTFVFVNNKEIFNILKIIFLYHYALFGVLLCLIRIRTYVQHFSENYNEKNISRTTLCNFFETLIIGCRMNFHFEHHIFPNIPYYRFKKSIKINKNKDIFSNFYNKTYFSYDF